MSGFGVAISWTGVPDQARVELLSSGIAHRGPDGVTTVRLERAVLTHAQFVTTPEAVRETQPSRHAARDWWLVADARIDNRDELALELSGSVEHPLDTDADFILAAYERWGTDLASHLMGDFGFAIWDGDQRHVVVVRDHVGIRPVYWARGTDGTFVAASTLRAVVDASGLPREPDLVYLAEYAALFESSDLSRSPWVGVHRVAGGHTLVARADGATASRYWDPRPEYRDVDAATAAVEVRRLFDQAVKCRLRSSTRVGVHVSGGFDSTSVAAAAVTLVGADQLVAISLTFPGLDCDETEYVDAAAAHMGIDIQRFNALDVPAYDFVDEARRSLDLPGLPDNQWNVPMAQALADQGCRVMLSGQGGDHAFYGWPQLAVAHLALAGHPLRAFTALRASGAGRVSSARRLAYTTGGEWTLRHPANLVSRTTRRIRAIRRLQTESVDERGYTTDLLHNLVGTPKVRTPFADPWGGSRGLRCGFYLGSTAWFVELWDRSAYEVPVDYRHPFFDVRLVEYVLSLGEHVVVDGYRARGLHRRAMAELLPDAVLDRTDKAEFSDPWRAAALRLFDDLTVAGSFERPEVTQLVAVAGVRALAERIRQDRLLDVNNWPWWGCVTIAAWFELPRPRQAE